MSSSVRPAGAERRRNIQETGLERDAGASLLLKRRNAQPPLSTTSEDRLDANASFVPDVNGQSGLVSGSRGLSRRGRVIL